MFNNVSGKLKICSWVVLIIGSVSSIVGGILCFSLANTINQVSSLSSYSLFDASPRSSGAGTGVVFLGIAVIVFGIALSYVFALLVRGFGQIVNNTQTLVVRSYQNDSDASAKPVRTAEAFKTPAASAPIVEPKADVIPDPEPAPAATPIVEAPAPEPEAPAAGQQVKYCGQCGTPNEMDYAFCMKCGSKLD